MFVIYTVVFYFICLFCFPVYEAGKAVKKGVPSQYPPTLYAPSMYGQPVYSGALMNKPDIPLLPLPNGAGAPHSHNGYGHEYDGASSGEDYSKENKITSHIF